MDALLVIDVQKALVQGAYREEEMLAAIRVATDKIRNKGGAIVYIQHCHTKYEPMKKGNPGWALHEALDVQSSDCFVEKEASDAFYETPLDALLKGMDVDHVYVVGLQTEYCVDATCRSALSNGYGVTLVGDAHTTGDDLLTAAQAVAHHNHILGNLAHPLRSIKVQGSEDI